MTIMHRVIDGLKIFQDYIPNEKQDVQTERGYIVSGFGLHPSELEPKHQQKLEHDGWMYEDEYGEAWVIATG